MKQDKEAYPASVQNINRLVLQPDSDKRTEPDKESTPTPTIKRELQPSIQGERQQSSEDKELPFQQGFPLKENIANPKIRSHNCEIFMAFLSDITNQKANSTALEDLDYDDFLSEPEVNEATTTSCKFLHLHQESQSLSIWTTTRR